MATDWRQVFRDRPDLEPEGFDEAVLLAAERVEQRRLVKECRKPSRRGRSGELS